ncbi:MAG: hypothetical protein J0L80_13185 [Chitinophagales bacterium]|nr:hypothetical protein [Chitinophagales bacterium]
MMFKDRKIIATVAMLALSGAFTSVMARPNIDNNGQLKTTGGQLKTTASTCKPAEAKIDLDINNVRARLMTGGDMWWDNGTGEARYEIPKGSRKNSLFAGSVWIGGKDAQGQLKVAAQTYRQDGNDYWPGPLDDQASVSEADCAEWDRFWKINKSDILKFRALSDPAAAGSDVSFETIVQWPAKGNPDAVGNRGNNLNLETATKSYAPFIDKDNDGKYEWKDGDYPDIFGDQFIWWVFNDKGNTKQQSQTEGIGIEVQASAFAYSTKDYLNDASFYNYRLVNRSNLQLDSTYVATWTDADLGYYRDDYIGCDTTRGLGILYNGASEDGNGQINSYGSKVPMVGVDFFKGPNKPNGDTVINGVTQTKYKRLGMESFTYYNNDGSIIGNPDNGTQIYNYMTGSIRNGQRFSNDFQGPGINSKAYGTTLPSRFVFFGDPENKSEWSECACLNPVGDRRFVHSAGPFKLEPGVVNDITIGAVWVADAGGCPTTSFKKIRVADDAAQALFDNNFQTIEGPEAPRLVAREMDRKIILYIVNDFGSNNFRERYGRSTDPKYRVSSTKAAKYVKSPDSLYKFEGYRIFQLKNSLVQPSQIYNADGSINGDVASEIYTCDIKNGVTRIINYDKRTDIGDSVYVPIVKVTGKDSGIVHSIEINTDKFANNSSNDTRLVNYRNYYFVAVAYAYNNFAPFNPRKVDSTQDVAYLESSHGAGGIPIPVVAAMPNPANGDMGTVLNADYGSGVIIKRLEGTGNGHNELRLTEESEKEALFGGTSQSVYPTYQPGYGPVKVKVIDPRSIQAANFELYIDQTTQSPTSNLLSPYNGWKLINTSNNDTIYSEGNYGIVEPDEQIIEKYGISVTIQQTLRPGEDQAGSNGLITSSITFDDPARQWLVGVQDEEARSLNNWIRSGHTSDTYSRCDYNDRTGLGYDTSAQIYENLLPLSPIHKGTWAPYGLATDENRSVCGFGVIKKATSSTLYNLPSVDIVLTSDKTKWTRCAVLEMQDEQGLSEGKIRKFTIRSHKSWNLDVDGSGRPTYSTTPGDTGMSWFPGYAINIETGERLNIVFGEDSWLKQYGGTDMIWNPTTDNISGFGSVINGGKHYIYVMNTRYDSCATFRQQMGQTEIQQNAALKTIQWVGLPLLAEGYQYKSIQDGLIPNDVRIRFRVDRPYAKYRSSLQTTPARNADAPLYSFSTTDLAPTPLKDQTNDQRDALLKRIHAVPNPYYAYSGFENNRLDTRVRIINLPKRATISIYSLDGSLIRKLEKDNPNVSFVDWDIRNAKGLPIASGMYLMHINAEGIGETVVKWFGAMRPIDIISY